MPKQTKYSCANPNLHKERPINKNRPYNKRIMPSSKHQPTLGILLTKPKSVEIR
jgi:hypothetical protein